MTVYLDVCFLMNMLMDFITLLAAGRLGGLRLQRRRLLAASAGGGAYAVLALLCPWAAWLPFQILVGAALCRAAFARQGPFGRIYALYLVVAASFAGLALALGAVSGQRLRLGAGYYFVVPLRLLLLAAAIGYAVSGLLLRGDARHGALRREITILRIRFMGKECTASVLQDTGNDLTEPVSGRPVLVLSSAALQPMLSGCGIVLQGLNAENAAQILSALPPAALPRFGLLPFHAVGTETGMLLYFRPDAVLQPDGSALDCVIAISPQPVGKGSYEGLIGV